MMPMPTGVRVWIAAGHTDMRRGMQGLALQVQEQLKRDPHGGDLWVFRGRRGQLPTFCIQFSPSEDSVPLASAVRPDIAGLTEPARQGSDVHLHG